MSEQDWQAAVLGELGVPCSGLVPAARSVPSAEPSPASPERSPAPAVSPPPDARSASDDLQSQNGVAVQGEPGPEPPSGQGDSAPRLTDLRDLRAPADQTADQTGEPIAGSVQQVEQAGRAAWGGEPTVRPEEQEAQAEWAAAQQAGQPGRPGQVADQQTQAAWGPEQGAWGPEQSGQPAWGPEQGAWGPEQSGQPAWDPSQPGQPAWDAGQPGQVAWGAEQMGAPAQQAEWAPEAGPGQPGSAEQAGWTPEQAAWAAEQDELQGAGWDRVPHHQAPLQQAPVQHAPGDQDPALANPALRAPIAGANQQQAADDLMRRAKHGDPVIRRVGRGVRRAVGPSPAQESRKTADIEAILQRPVASCRRIAITSIRGGAGKTTMAALTATLIAQYRQDKVLAVDSDSGLGSLPLRTGINAGWSLHDFVAANTGSWEEAVRYLSQTPSGLWVLSSTAGGRIGSDLRLETFQAAAGQLNRYFGAMVVDCGAGLLAELQRGILAEAHAQVMVTPGTADGALSARGALDWLVRNGYEHLLARTVIALVTHTPHVDADLGRAAQMLSAGGVPVVHMPYDRHLAAGASIDPDRVAHTTRSAAIQVAVEVFGRSTTI